MFRTASGVLLAVVCAGVLSRPAGAAPAPAANVEPQLQALKADTIQLGAELEAAGRALLYPEGTLATVHVTVRGTGSAFLLESVSIRVDGGPPQRHDYTGAEAIALLSAGGWHRLARLRLAVGTHRLQAEFSGRFHDARAGEPPVTGRVEAQFDQGAGDLDLVLPLMRDRMSRAVTLAPPEALTAATDAPYRRALFLRNANRLLSALVELKGAPDTDGTLLLGAECYAGLGMDAQADALYRRIAAGHHDAVTLGRAQLQLAQFDYQHGRFDRAAERLRAVGKDLPATLRNDWRALLTGVLLGQGRNADVAALLGDDDESVPPLLRFNLAVALIRGGKAAEGREQLEALGTLETTDLEQLVLRDKANLTLGYQHLQEQRGAAARAAFARIRAQGPYSNRGLLGLGWADVAQAAPARAKAPAAGSLGALLQSAPVAAGQRLDIEGAATATSALPATEQDALRRALRAWLELVKRDPMDPAVQEGFLAIPWALDRLHADEPSVARYLEAITALETARGRMDEAMRSIRRSVMVDNIVRRDADSERGWLWKVRDLPNVPETYFLQSLLAEHRFQEALKLYRDAGMLARRLDEWKLRAPGAPAALRARIDALAVQAAALGSAQHKQVEALSAGELEGQRATIERYLTEARFAVARIYDRAHGAGAP